MSVVFVMYVELSIDSSSPLWPGGRERTLVIRIGRFASYGSSGNHVLSLTGAVLDPWAERCTYLAENFLLSSLGHTLTTNVARGRWITGMQAQMMPRFGSMILHSMITTVLSEFDQYLFAAGNPGPTYTWRRDRWMHSDMSLANS